MKVLTLTQPWATLVAIGAKKIETRSWATHYQGPLAIHAAKGFPGDCRRLAESKKFMAPIIKAFEEGVFPWTVIYQTGVILTTCELITCVEITKHPQQVTHRYMKTEIGEDGHLYFNFCAEDLDIFVPPPEPELSFGDYTPGRFAWILDKIQPLSQPIPAKGSLGLWEYPGL